MEIFSICCPEGFEIPPQTPLSSSGVSSLDGISELSADREVTHELGKLWSDEGAGKPQLEGALLVVTVPS